MQVLCHKSEKCWEKFDRPEWAQLSESDSSTPRRTQDYSSTFPGSSTVILTQEYDRLRQLEFSQTNFSATHASTSGMHAYTTSPQKSWILDSGASSHMQVV